MARRSSQSLKVVDLSGPERTQRKLEEAASRQASHDGGTLDAPGTRLG